SVAYSAIPSQTCKLLLGVQGMSSCAPTTIVKKNNEHWSYFTWSGSAGSGSSYYEFIPVVNPSYNPDYIPEFQEVDYEEIQIALQQALLNNNAMQAVIIADAITAAYTYDVVGFNELYNSLSVTYQQVAERIAQNSK